MQDSVGNAGDVGQIMKDKMFLRAAAESGIAEIKFSQLALEKSTTDDVKTFGQKMIDDHTQLNAAMSPVADAMGIRLPKEMNKEDQAAYEKLNTLSGSDFETAYLTQMLKMHRKSMRNYRIEANSVTESQLSDFVAKGEHTIHEHLVMVNKLAKDKGVPMPQHAGKPAPPPPS
jgi:putative membrane protein